MTESEPSEQCSEPVVDSSFHEEIECEPSTTPQTPKDRKRKRETNDPIGAALIRLEETKIKLLENQSKTPDDDQSFLNSLLPHMRSLPVQD